MLSLMEGEELEFEEVEVAVAVILTKPVLGFISFFLKRANARHLTEIKHATKEF